jgi:prepilin-type N-terminal cleavage/methylation domain-containing protein
MKNKQLRQGFTLIELLTVIAIIGILASILIPSVSMVKRNVNVAASKAVLSQYMNAIQTFRSEYNFLPFTDLVSNGRESFNLSSSNNSEIFVETLTARDAITNNELNQAIGGNRRRIRFYEFSDAEFYQDDRGYVRRNQIVDRFNNRKIVIVLDVDGDGVVRVPDPENPRARIELRASMTAYVEADSSSNAPDYYLYE